MGTPTQMSKRNLTLTTSLCSGCWRNDPQFGNELNVIKCVAEFLDLDGGDASTSVIYSKYILKLLYCTD